MVAVTAACLVGPLWTALPGLAQPELDCARPTQGRELIARLRLAEIEGAEDIHRATMCERERFEAEWEGKRAQIEARYRAVLSDFERRCRAIISRARPGPLRAAS